MQIGITSILEGVHISFSGLWAPSTRDGFDLGRAIQRWRMGIGGKRTKRRATRPSSEHSAVDDLAVVYRV